MTAAKTNEHPLREHCVLRWRVGLSLSLSLSLDFYGTAVPLYAVPVKYSDTVASKSASLMSIMPFYRINLDLTVLTMIG